MKSISPQTAEEVLAELEGILAAPEFHNSPRSRDFLRHVVIAFLAGKPDEVTQHAIASEVLGRQDDFDPVTDPAVRMLAGRVRRSLEHYYLTRGVRNDIRIELPKGSYFPRIARSEPAPEPPGCAAEGSGSIWPRLLVMPFRNLTGDSAVAHVAQGVATQLAIELSQYRETEVILSAGEEDPRNLEVAAHYEVQGSVTMDGDGLRISVHVLGAERRRLLWGHAYSTQRSESLPGAFFNETVGTVAAILAGERGVVAQDMDRRHARLADLAPTAYDAILRYHHFDRSPTLELYRKARESLELAIRSQPDCAPCLGYLARLLAFSYAHGFSQGEGVIDQAIALAEQGVRLDPGDQRLRAILGYAHLLNDQVEDARRDAEDALAMNPQSLLILDGLGYLLTLSGDWERGPALSWRAIRSNPFHLPIVHAGLWLDAIRRLNFEDARCHAMRFMTPGSFWDPLMKIVALAHGDQVDQARAEIPRLLSLEPEFRQRSRWLITRYVKFPSLVDTITEGLEKAGVDRAPEAPPRATSPSTAHR